MLRAIATNLLHLQAVNRAEEGSPVKVAKYLQLSLPMTHMRDFTSQKKNQNSLDRAALECPHRRAEERKNHCATMRYCK